MSFALKLRKPIGRQLKRIARKELAAASERLLQGHRGDEDVHEARKSVKKVEALARLLNQIGFGPPVKVVKWLRESRRVLSRLRDAHAIMETYDHLRRRFPRRIPEHTSAMIRRHLMRRKSTLMRQAQAAAGRLSRAGKRLRNIRRSVRDWRRSSIDLLELPQVLRQSFRVSRKAMRRAQTRGQAADFHDWRKGVKNLWYQLRLAERLVAGLRMQGEEFKELETALGEEHNLVVLRSMLMRDRGLRNIKSQTDRLAAMSTALQEELRRSALVLGTRLHTMSAKEFEKDLRQRLRPKGTPRRKPAPDTRGKAVA